MAKECLRGDYYLVDAGSFSVAVFDSVLRLTELANPFARLRVNDGDHRFVV
jgi:hypothetical protein